MNELIKLWKQEDKISWHKLTYTVEPQFFEVPRDRQSSSKNRGFEKLNDLEKRGVLTKLVCDSGIKETGDGTLLLTWSIR